MNLKVRIRPKILFVPWRYKRTVVKHIREDNSKDIPNNIYMFSDAISTRLRPRVFNTAITGKYTRHEDKQPNVINAYDKKYDSVTNPHTHHVVSTAGSNIFKSMRCDSEKLDVTKLFNVVYSDRNHYVISVSDGITNLFEESDDKLLAMLFIDTVLSITSSTELDSYLFNNALRCIVE